jgi:cob(I)alamin adenosyltransferase
VVRIYTRTGDDGTTGLVGGKRTTKDAPLIEVCGQLDELNAMIGVVRSGALPDKADRALELVQNDLFIIGAEIMTPDGIGNKSGGIHDENILDLEKEIDAIEKELEPLRSFILPGGARTAAELHMTRAIARRTERHCIALSRIQKVSPQVLCYLNRLSDLCFVLARYLNRQQGVAEPHLSRASF